MINDVYVIAMLGGYCTWEVRNWNGTNAQMWDWRVGLHKNGKWKIFFLGGCGERKIFLRKERKNGGYAWGAAMLVRMYD